MRTVALVLLFVAGCHAGVEGVVMNGTTGKPQRAATVSLLKLSGAGMEPVATVKSDALGKFRVETTPDGAHLLQTIYRGVAYNQVISSGSSTTGLTLEVFDSSTKRDLAKATQDVVVFEPGPKQLNVTESIILQNNSKLAFYDAVNGTVRVFLPQNAQQARISATAPHGLPVERTAEKTNEPGVYKIAFPIKPGETRIDVSYFVPFSTPGQFKGRGLQKDAGTKLVAPPGVTLQGDGLELLGQEPQTRAAIYAVKGPEYVVEIRGAGTLQMSGQQEEQDNGPSLDQILPRIYDRVYWIVGLGLATLFVGFLLLYRVRAEQSAVGGPSSSVPPEGKHHS